MAAQARAAGFVVSGNFSIEGEIEVGSFAVSIQIVPPAIVLSRVSAATASALIPTVTGIENIVPPAAAAAANALAPQVSGEGGEGATGKTGSFWW